MNHVYNLGASYFILFTEILNWSKIPPSAGFKSHWSCQFKKHHALFDVASPCITMWKSLYICARKGFCLCPQAIWLTILASKARLARKKGNLKIKNTLKARVFSQFLYSKISDTYRCSSNIILGSFWAEYCQTYFSLRATCVSSQYRIYYAFNSLNSVSLVLKSTTIISSQNYSVKLPSHCL